MKYKIILLLTTMTLLMACTGCGKQTRSESLTPTQELEEQQEQDRDADDKKISEETEKVNPANGDELFESSNLNGAVVEITNNGCKITPTYTQDDVAYEAAPGYENQEELITVAYDEDCTFQAAYINLQTNAVTYDAAAISDVKEQTSLVIYGEYDSDSILHASVVFIYEWN